MFELLEDLQNILLQFKTRTLINFEVILKCDLFKGFISNKNNDLFISFRAIIET